MNIEDRTESNKYLDNIEEKYFVLETIDAVVSSPYSKSISD